MKRAVKRAVAVVAVALACTACGMGGEDGSTAPPTTSATAASSPAAPGTASADTVAWAGQVCSEVEGLGTSLRGVAADAVRGGDVQGALQAATDELTASADRLVTTLSSPPQGAESEVGPIRTSATELRTTLDTLQQKVTALQDASGAVGTVTALKGVTDAAKSSLDAAGSTSSAIRVVTEDSGSTLRAAFETNPQCADLIR
ncbi:MAG TPA: hypothetical protein VES95_09870 [Dermatophilaceae bacterium]|nr:hypothetical protein [Dermatophilaceae bacterium]